MDTITHGIAGALIGKAVFRGEDMFASHPMNRGRIITWSLMFGAIFPDSDVLRDMSSPRKTAFPINAPAIPWVMVSMVKVYRNSMGSLILLDEEKRIFLCHHVADAA